MKMSSPKKSRWFAAMTIALLVPGSILAGVCEPLSPFSDNVLEFGRDYRPRLDFQHPDLGGCTTDISTEGVAEFSLWAWNLHHGIQGANFQLVSDGEIVSFAPAANFSLVQGGTSTWVEGLSRLDVDLVGSDICGPVAVGIVSIQVPEGADGVFVVLDGYGAAGMPRVVDVSGLDMEAVSPFHGAYAGAVDLYHCQPALCAEPLAPINDLTPVQSGDTVIELGWTAGDGDFTMIRYRGDGLHPTSIFDGQLLTLFPANEGQWQTITHTNPDVPMYWYSAFNVRNDGLAVTLGSHLECGSFTSGSVDESIPNEDTTWSSVKTRYR